MTDFVFLDSGTGGIPYLTLLKQLAPQANCVYVADTKNFPYGQKEHNQIVQCVTEVVEKIVKKFEPKVIVIACNTISVNALGILREIFPDVFFVGTVPAIKLAASVTKNKCIGLLATNSTINNPYNLELKEHFAKDCKLVLRADPDLISFVEHKSFTASKEERLKAIMPAVDFFRKEGADTIILGCTHFLNLKEDFIEACGSDIMVVDSMQGVVNRALQLGMNMGFGGESPDRRGSGKPEVWSEGKAFPTQNKKTELYVTGFMAQSDEKEYNVICRHYDFKWCGEL